MRPSTAQRRLLKFAPVALDLVEQVELEVKGNSGNDGDEGVLEGSMDM